MPLVIVAGDEWVCPPSASCAGPEFASSGRWCRLQLLELPSRDVAALVRPARPVNLYALAGPFPPGSDPAGPPLQELHRDQAACGTIRN